MATSEKAGECWFGYVLWYRLGHGKNQYGGEGGRVSHYAGITTDVARRYHQHYTGKGAKALRGAKAMGLVWRSQVAVTRGQALRGEARVKKLLPQLKGSPAAIVECWTMGAHGSYPDRG